MSTSSSTAPVLLLTLTFLLVHTYSSWSALMEHHWGDGSRFQIAVEKPSGEGRDSLGSATQPEASSRGFFAEELLSGRPWLSSIMNKHLPERLQILEPLSGVFPARKECRRSLGQITKDKVRWPWRLPRTWASCATWCRAPSSRCLW